MRRPGRPDIRIGRNVFCSRQIRIHLHTSLLQIEGHVRFGPLTPLRYDIMGPFRFVPGMECRHSVYSMTHTVRGRLTVNGTEYRFDDGLGYIEGDRGRSFPRRYLWTQCHFGSDALMLSAADIPVGPLQFTGIIGVVFLRGREYRLATYLGARITRLGDGAVEVQAGEIYPYCPAYREDHAPALRPVRRGNEPHHPGKRGLLRRLPVLSGQHGAA